MKLIYMKEKKMFDSWFRPSFYRYYTVQFIVLKAPIMKAWNGDQAV